MAKPTLQRKRDRLYPEEAQPQAHTVACGEGQRSGHLCQASGGHGLAVGRVAVRLGQADHMVGPALHCRDDLTIMRRAQRQGGSMPGASSSARGIWTETGVKAWLASIPSWPYWLPPPKRKDDRSGGKGKKGAEERGPRRKRRAPPRSSPRRG